MTDETPPGSTAAVLNRISTDIVEGFQRDAGDRVTIVHGDDGQWVAIEEVTSSMTFVEAAGDRLRIVPLLTDAESLRARPFAHEIKPSFVDGENELVVDVSAVSTYADRGQLIDLMHSALDYWTQTTARAAEPAPPPEPDPLDLPVFDFADPDVDGLPESETEPEPDLIATVDVQVRADISDQWSWASSAARIPQISNLTVAASAPVEHARISVVVSDADVQYGSTLVGEGGVAEGMTALGSVSVALSPRVMSQVDERQGATCVITVEDVSNDRLLSRYEQAIDVQPRDLWFAAGDPRRSDQLQRMVERHREIVMLIEQEPARADLADLAKEKRQLEQALDEQHSRSVDLSKALLASFVRPNHPEIPLVAREAADIRGQLVGNSSFYAFQMPERDPSDVEAVSAEVDASVTAVYEALRARRIAYSEPPPGWDYRGAGQRIRDHGDVARHGLGTCLDTTVLTAAVLEHIGLSPVLILIPGHIFIGYWRRDPEKSGVDGAASWHPTEAVLTDPARIQNLIDAGYLGVIETTAFTVTNDDSAADARGEARVGRLPTGVTANDVTAIDVTVARRLGVSPLPAINERPDGITEIHEYRQSGRAPATEVTEVTEEDVEEAPRERRADPHPARYRTWKSSLFSLNATNSLLNLGTSARVQPVVLPSQGLALLEDRLNQDTSFELRSGYNLPEVLVARDVVNAAQLVQSGRVEDRDQLMSLLGNRQLFVQRSGRSKGEPAPISRTVCARELRSMAYAAKTAREERGMNTLFLCLGLLRWEYKPGVKADAPLILVPVNLTVSRGRENFTLSLDTSQQTTPNAALIEWLRREHGLAIPGLAEPLTDRAGIDVDAVINEVRNAVLGADLSIPIAVVSEARLATLDLSAFRMWQDLNLHADHFFERPLVKHLVHTPTDTFDDTAAEQRGSHESDASGADLEALETPIPADSTQKRAVLWAKQGRTFVLQGPPGTGKSQTITNMVAESLLSGMRVLFVAEKGTALAVVQRRLESIGLGPFTLNLHHEGSNASEVRAQLKRALNATVDPDAVAMQNARRQLRTARFELTSYPEHLHKPNAAGKSAYAAHDELMVLGDGATLPVSTTFVAHQADQIESLRDLFAGLQEWTSAAGVRRHHPWRFAGPGAGDPFDLGTVSSALRDILAGVTWGGTVAGPLGEVLQALTHPSVIESLSAAASPALPSGAELVAVLDTSWPSRAGQVVDEAARRTEAAQTRLHGFPPEVLALDLRGMAAQLETANSSGFLGRKGRQAAAIAPLSTSAPTTVDLTPAVAQGMLRDLISAQDENTAVRDSIRSTPGLANTAPTNAFTPDALLPSRHRLEELIRATSALRDGHTGVANAVELARGGHLAGHQQPLASYSAAWKTLGVQLAIKDADFEIWRDGQPLAVAVDRDKESWQRDIEYERLVPLQRWCTLVRKLEPLRLHGLAEARAALLDGTLPAYTAEEALARGIASASQQERIRQEGLDLFDSVAHDQRVATYADAQTRVRKQWITDGPARLLEARGAGGVGSSTGGLARELEKTTRKLGTRPILRKYGEAVQQLTPLVLCSPSSVVDLIEPGVMEFDLVIFDEASQITVPESVGALGRARAAIVVGDSKQMPPTRKIGGGAGDDEIDDPDAEEVVEDQESILSECELARVPTLSLSWHYRSQDEALIAFSNRTYYRGELSSFPTPTLLSDETGLELRPVHDPERNDLGMYLRAGSGKVDLGNGVVAGTNTNPHEALAIRDYVLRLVHESDTLPSVGIVTFNEQQRLLIDELLHNTADARLADVLDESVMGRGEALFVKALEQVQGDERDIVIFSVAFSKQANGKVPTNFGPLANAGGERRLNVAITRARRKNIVFCSFDPSSNELDVSGSTYQGPKDLKQFLIDAKIGTVADQGSEAPGRVAVRDRHRDDIADALRSARLHVMTDVGMSNFRLDLVLARAETPDRPVLPVLLDGESWMKRTTVSDRDVLPVEVLENLMGWPRVARIWWPMWLQNRDGAIAQILREVELAEARAQGEEPTEPSTAAASAPVVAPVLAAASTPPAPTAPVVEPAASQSRTPSETQGTASVAPAAHQSWSDPAPALWPGAQDDLLNDLEDPALHPAESDVDHGTDVDAAVDATHGAAANKHPAGAPPSPDDDAQEAVDQVAEFVPAHAEIVGPRDTLDRLGDRAAAALVLEQLVDVIETEGPVALSRLVRLVARRFGLTTVRAARADDILRLVPRELVRRDRRLGDFAWPSTLDPEIWPGFRYADQFHSRSLDEVAPEELANAMLAVWQDTPDVEYVDDILRPTAELFGITRLGANVRARLEAIYETLPVEK